MALKATDELAFGEPIGGHGILGFADQKLGCGPGALLKDDGAVGNDLIDDLLGVVANGNELKILVVAKVESAAEPLLKFL